MNIQKTDSFAGRYKKEVEYFVRAGRFVAQAERQSPIDVVFIQSNNALNFAIAVVKKFTKAKIVYNEQDVFPDNAFYSGLLPAFAFKALRRLQGHAYRQCDRIITISYDMKKVIEGYLGEPWSKAIDVVFNWHPNLPDGFNDASNPLVGELAARDQASFRVVYAGTVGKMQNIEVLVRAAKMLENRKEMAFYIFGNGSSKATISALVEELNCKNVHIRNSIDATRAPYLYSMASVNYIPLIRNGINTCLPSKTAVCFASTRPLIVQVDVDSDFAKRVSCHEGVYVVPPNDAETLARVLLHVFLRYGTKGSPIVDTWPQGSGDDYRRMLEQTACRESMDGCAPFKKRTGL